MIVRVWITYKKGCSDVFEKVLTDHI